MLRAAFSSSNYRSVPVTPTDTTYLNEFCLDVVFDMYSSNGEFMTGDEFIRFMADYQMEDVSDPARLQEVFSRLRTLTRDGVGLGRSGVMDNHEHLKRAKGRAEAPAKVASGVPGPEGCVSRDEFFCYIRSPELNNGFDTYERARVTHNMDQPLAHYWVASSHNTYLPGGQFFSSASADAYREALLRGCRCVELDVWNGNNGDPIVTHGKAQVTPVSFRSCLDVIARYAFVVSEYPIILSLEMHATGAQQDRVALHLHEAFGDTLFTAADADVEEHFHSLTPNALRGRVLVKNSLVDKGIWRSFPGARVRGDERMLAALEGKMDGCCFMASQPAANYREFGSGKMRPWHVVSLSEPKCERLSLKENDLIMDTTCDMFVRVYPKGTRITSSNYNPMAGWRAGAQLVALNYQTEDWPVRLNDAFFAQNGGSGWVLKPSAMLRPRNERAAAAAAAGAPPVPSLRVWSGDGARYGPPNGAVDLTSSAFRKENKGGAGAALQVAALRRFPQVQVQIRIDALGCYNLPNDKDILSDVDPCLTVKVSGIRPDCAHMMTQFISDNRVPFFGHPFIFNIRAPQLAVLSLLVHDKDRNPFRELEFIGDFHCPVDCLNEGLRALPLRGPRGLLTGPDGHPSVLIARVELQRFVPRSTRGVEKAEMDPMMEMRRGKGAPVQAVATVDDATRRWTGQVVSGLTGRPQAAVAGRAPGGVGARAAGAVAGVGGSSGRQHHSLTGHHRSAGLTPARGSSIGRINSTALSPYARQLLSRMNAVMTSRRSRGALVAYSLGCLYSELVLARARPFPSRFRVWVYSAGGGRETAHEAFANRIAKHPTLPGAAPVHGPASAEDAQKLQYALRSSVGVLTGRPPPPSLHVPPAGRSGGAIPHTEPAPRRAVFNEKSAKDQRVIGSAALAALHSTLTFTPSVAPTPHSYVSSMPLGAAPSSSGVHSPVIPLPPSLHPSGSVPSNCGPSVPSFMNHNPHTTPVPCSSSGNMLYSPHGVTHGTHAIHMPPPTMYTHC